MTLSAAAVTAIVVPVAITTIVVAVAIVMISVAATAQTIDLAVRGTENRAKAAAGFWFCGRGEHIQREPDMFEVSAGVTGHSSVRTGFRHTSAQRLNNHIDGTEQFYDGEQTDGNVNRNRRTHGCIAIGYSDGITFAAIVVMVVAGVTATIRIAQICLQGNGFAFCNGEGAAVGIAAAVVQIGGSGDIGFRGTKQGHPQVITVGGRNAANETTIGATEFQRIVENIFQFQIPAAFLQRIGFLSQNFDAIQLQITDGYIGGVAGGNDNIALTQHIVAAVAVASCGAGRTQNIGSQAFLDAALIEDLLGDDAGFSGTVRTAVVTIVITVAVSCGQIKFKSSHKTASLKLFVFFYIV